MLDFHASHCSTVPRRKKKTNTTCHGGSLRSCSFSLTEGEPGLFKAAEVLRPIMCDKVKLVSFNGWNIAPLGETCKRTMLQLVACLVTWLLGLHFKRQMTFWGKCPFFFVVVVHAVIKLLRFAGHS